MGSNCCSRSEEQETEILRPEKTIISNHSRTQLQNALSKQNLQNPYLSSYEKDQKEDLYFNSSLKNGNQNDSQIDQTTEKLKSPIIIPEKDNSQQNLQSEQFNQKIPEFSTPLKEEQNLNEENKNNTETNNEKLQNNISENKNQQDENNNKEEYKIEYTYETVENNKKIENNKNENIIKEIKEIPNNENTILNNGLGQKVKYTTVVENIQPAQKVIYGTQNIPQNEIILQSQPILFSTNNNIPNTQIYQTQPITKIIYTDQNGNPISIQNDPNIIVHPDYIVQNDQPYIIQNEQIDNPEIIYYNDPQLYNQQIISNDNDLENPNNLLQTNENLQIINQSSNEPNTILVQNPEGDNGQFLDYSPRHNKKYKSPNNEYHKTNISISSTPNNIDYQPSSKRENNFIEIENTPERSVDYPRIPEKYKEMIDYKSPSRNPNYDYESPKKVQNVKFKKVDRSNKIIEKDNNSVRTKNRYSKPVIENVDYQQNQQLIRGKNNVFSYQPMTFQVNNDGNNLSNEFEEMEPQFKYSDSSNPYQENNDDYYSKNKNSSVKKFNNNSYNKKEQSYSSGSNNVIKNANRNAMYRQADQNNYYDDYQQNQNYSSKNSQYSKNNTPKKILVDKSVKLNDEQSDLQKSLINYFYNINEQSDFNPEMWRRFYPKNERFFLFDKGHVIPNQLINENDPNYPEEINTYKGEVNENGLKHGEGKYSAPDFERIGSWRYGKFTGWGRETRNNGEIFEGKFIDGEISGKGVYKNPNGDLYIGDFSHSVKNGKGELFTRKFHYKGNFDNNRINGKGKIEFIDGGHTFEGQFKNNQINGKGIFKWKNGDVYEGEMRDGKMDGLGIFKSANGFVYEGYFKNGVEEGFGKLRYPNGKVFEGEFVNGKPFREKRASGRIYYGVYQGNKDDLK